MGETMSLLTCEECWNCCLPCAAACVDDGREERVRAKGTDDGADRWTCCRFRCLALDLNGKRCVKGNGHDVENQGDRTDDEIAAVVEHVVE